MKGRVTVKKLEQVFIVVLSLLFVILFAGCSQSEAAKAMDEQIEAIGEVTLSSLPKIKVAERVYRLLDEKDKKQVRKYKDLLNARATYSQMRADTAIAYINDIGVVDTYSGEKIDTAEKYFNDLSSEELSLVTNRETLEKAITEYDNLFAKEAENLIEQAVNDFSKISFAQATYDKLNSRQKDLVKNYEKLSDARALQVVGMIDKISGISLEDTKPVEEAQEIYDSLSFNEKKKVTNRDKLYEAQSKIKELKEKEKEQELILLKQRIQEKYDEVNDTTWYRSANEPAYRNIRSYMLPSIIKTENAIMLGIAYNYAGNDWIFFKEAQIVTDTNRYKKTFNYFDIVHETAFGGMLSERLIVPASKSDIDMLRDMATSQKAIIRLQGDAHYYDINLSAGDKQGILDILALYEFLADEPGIIAFP